jgi:hypothetical protein
MASLATSPESKSPVSEVTRCTLTFVQLMVPPGSTSSTEGR